LNARCLITTTKEAAEQFMTVILKVFDENLNSKPKEQNASDVMIEGSPSKNGQIRILQRPLTIQPKKVDQ
jgi:hypothetical protein